MRTQKVLAFTMVLFTLSVGIVIGTLINQGVKAAYDDRAVAAPGATPLVIPNPVELSNSFSQIAKQMEPSVVNISTTYLPKAPSRSRNNMRRFQQQQPDDGDQGDQGDDPNDFLFRFFGGNPFASPDGGGGRKSSALGSGVVVDKAGYILTNNHVVDKADIIKVKFNGDSTEYDAKVVGVDVPTDLAVIRVEGKRDLAAAKIGNSDAVQVGDWAVAIGSPFGYQATVTAGIISAKSRDIDPTMQFQHFLQTDAAINPGNSGGPLLNIRGEVIGINTAIASRSGGYQGIGFALPINTAVKVYNDIIRTGKVVRGSIGVRFTPSDTDRSQANLKVAGVKQGVFIEQVVPGGPSEKAGLKEGDVITAINGKPVQDGNQLVDSVTQTPVGNALNVTVVRDGRPREMKIVVGDLSQIFPETYGKDSAAPSGQGEGTTVSFGMQVKDLTSSMLDNLGLKEKGVQVVAVDPGSFADDIQLLPGDVITAVNRMPVTNTADLKRIQQTLKPGDAVQVKVLRRANVRSTDWQGAYLAGTLPTNH
ncbi:MAG: Do family serine endopeptidase [Acidobacteria bacterium]|nr:Do family serine endopeptidase [Acidobacteriota bacterium]